MEKISTNNPSYEGLSQATSKYNEEDEEEEEDTVYDDDEWDEMSDMGFLMSESDSEDEEESFQTLPLSMPIATPSADKPMHKYPFKLQRNEAG